MFTNFHCWRHCHPVTSLPSAVLSTKRKRDEHDEDEHDEDEHDEDEHDEDEHDEDEHDEDKHGEDDDELADTAFVSSEFMTEAQKKRLSLPQRLADKSWICIIRACTKRRDNNSTKGGSSNTKVCKDHKMTCIWWGCKRLPQAVTSGKTPSSSQSKTHCAEHLAYRDRSHKNMTDSRRRTAAKKQSKAEKTETAERDDGIPQSS